MRASAASNRGKQASRLLYEAPQPFSIDAAVVPVPDRDMKRASVVLTVLLAVLVSQRLQVRAQDGPQVNRRDWLRTEFLNFDVDRDRKLSSDEYAEFVRRHLSKDDAVARAGRDIRLFDQNKDGKLDLTEVLTIPSLLRAWEREPTEDPLQRVVVSYVEKLDRGFKEFAADGAGKVPLKLYVSELATVLAVPREAVAQLEEADGDRDQFVSRREARLHIERLLGIRRPNGQLLRYPDGRVVKYQYWRRLDLNWSETLRLSESLRAAEVDGVREWFNLADLDQDGVVAYDEFCRSKYGVVDVPALFVNWDADFDGLLSEVELHRAVSSNLQPLVTGLFPAFDDDRDGKLSLAEFSLTPLSNETLKWETFPIDANRDRKLSFNEFRFGGLSAAYPLLLWEMFRRYDARGTGLLEKKQFDFIVPEAFQLCSMKPDGSDLQDVKVPGVEVAVTRHFAVGPMVNQFCVVGHRQWQPFLVRFDGNKATELGGGTSPDWSPDGKRIAFLVNNSSWVIGVCQPDGSDSRRLARGKNAKWSPDSKRLAAVQGTIVFAVDATTGEASEILDTNRLQDRALLREVEWSPDGAQLAVCLQLVDKQASQILIVESAGAVFGVKQHSVLHRHISGLSWHPTEPRLTFVMHCPERRRDQIYELDPTSDSAPTLMKGQDPHASASNTRWTRDGSRLWMQLRD